MISKAIVSSIILSDTPTSSTITYDAFDKEILCHENVLSALPDNIYKIFENIELWKALELKYGSTYKDLSKCSCEKIIEFQMVNNKPIFHKIHEFENIVYDKIKKYYFT